MKFHETHELSANFFKLTEKVWNDLKIRLANFKRNQDETSLSPGVLMLLHPAQSKMDFDLESFSKGMLWQEFCIESQPSMVFLCLKKRFFNSNSSRWRSQVTSTWGGYLIPTSYISYKSYIIYVYIYLYIYIWYIYICIYIWYIYISYIYIIYIYTYIYISYIYIYIYHIYIYISYIYISYIYIYIYHIYIYIIYIYIYII